MKKILTMALCLAAVGSMSAQKATVDQAKKLSGKIDKIEEVRGLILEASKNPETANDVYTYYVGGKAEYDAYDEAIKKRMINPNDKDVDPLAMGEQLVNGYKMFVKALPLDSVVDAKGKVKAKYSKDMLGKIFGHFNDYFNAGGNLYNAKKYYPGAYEAFMIYGDLAKSPLAPKNIQALPDSVVNTAYFNAGLSAYAGNALPEAATAFKKARLNNSDNSQNYIYEIACWQYMAQNDSTLQNASTAAIEDIARAGYNRFGMAQPLFMNNLVNSYVIEGNFDKAVNLIGEELSKNPESPAMYGLRGFVYDRMDNADASLADYRKAASYANADFETLKNASKKIFKEGTMKWNKIEGNSAEARAARADVKTNYFEAAKAIADRAKALNPDDSDVDYILENINYALETYFPNK